MKKDELIKIAKNFSIDGEPVKIEKCKGEKNISLQYYISVLKYESTRGCGLDGRAAGMEVTE